MINSDPWTKASKAVGWEPRDIPYPRELTDVQAASLEQLMEWNRFLPSPKTDHQHALLAAILTRISWARKGGSC